GPTVLAEKYVVSLPATARQPERFQPRVIGFDKRPFDPDVDHKRTAGQPLAVSTVTGVNDQRACGQFVPGRSASASTFEVHDPSSSPLTGITLRAVARSTTRHRYQLATVR